MCVPSGSNPGFNSSLRPGSALHYRAILPGNSTFVMLPPAPKCTREIETSRSHAREWFGCTCVPNKNTRIENLSCGEFLAAYRYKVPFFRASLASLLKSRMGERMIAHCPLSRPRWFALCFRKTMLPFQAACGSLTDNRDRNYLASRLSNRKIRPNSTVFCDFTGPIVPRGNNGFTELSYRYSSRVSM